MEPRVPSPLPATALHRAILVRVSQLLFQQAGVAVILFAAAGTSDFPGGWRYLALTTVLLGMSAGYLIPRHPEIVAARGRFHRDTKPYDRVILPIYTLANAAVFVAAGLEWRITGTGLGPPWVALGMVLTVVCTVPMTRALAVNRHLETTGRIQTDRAHAVVTTGPYRFVRHPMYAALLFQIPAVALTVGSVWALMPALAAVIVVVVRTLFEDRMLQAELTGYSEYALHTRWRLIPGVW